MERLEAWINAGLSLQTLGLKQARQDVHLPFQEAYQPGLYTHKTAVADFWVVMQYAPFVRGVESRPVPEGLATLPSNIVLFFQDRARAILSR